MDTGFGTFYDSLDPAIKEKIRHTYLAEAEIFRIYSSAPDANTPANAAASSDDAKSIPRQEASERHDKTGSQREGRE